MDLHHGGEEPCTAPCMRCGELVNKEDDFCPNCGTLRIDHITCSNHPTTDAAGVCVVCADPFCSVCGGFVNGVFLCDAHASCEIFEGMIRVFGALDDVTCQYVKASLEQNGLHPILYCPSQPLGGSRVVSAQYSGYGDYRGHLAGEIKVLVPCQEYEAAERVLHELDLPT